MFHIEREIQDFVVLTRLFGEIDLNAMDQVTQAFDTALALTTPPHPLVVDLEGVTFLASAGLDALCSLHARAAELGSELRVVATRREVLRPLQLTGLADEFGVHATAADATAPRPAVVPN